MSYHYVYVIQLEEGNFYVGRAQDPEAALFSHKYNTTSNFVKKFKPYGEGGFTNAPFKGDEDDVDEVTRHLMSNFGPEKVRNCTRYTDENLSPEQLSEIELELSNLDLTKSTKTYVDQTGQKQEAFFLRLKPTADVSYQYVYILELCETKFFVGLSSDPELALFNHQFKDDNNVINKFPPLGQGSFMMAPFVGSVDDVAEVTRSLMLQYGYDNVRNSTTYTSVTLTAQEIIRIKTELDIAKYDSIVQKSIKTILDKEGKEVQVEEEKTLRGQEKLMCQRCCRMYHCQAECTVYRDILGKVIPEMPEIYKPKKIEPAGPPNKRRKAVESSAFPYARGNGTVNIKFNGQAPTKYESDSDEEEEDSPDTGDSTTDTDSDASYDEAYDNENDKEICVERGILY